MTFGLLALALTVSAQATAAPSPGSDVSSDLVKATGSTSVRSLGDRFSETINVKDYGAKGDAKYAGTALVSGTDDTAAIQAAIAAALQTGKTLRIPSGVYLYTAAGFTIDVTGSQRSFRIEGDGPGKTILLVNANGRIFNVLARHADPDDPRPFNVSGVQATLLDPSVNTNATLFYITNGNAWGAQYHFSECYFFGWTYAAVHAIRAFGSTMNRVVCEGGTPYWDGLALQPVDNACVRLWGADGTTAPQAHAFSNGNVFRDSYFRDARYGIDGWAMSENTLTNTAIERCWIGFISRTPITTFAKPDDRAVQDTAKGARGFYFNYVRGGWFEQNAKWHISHVDVDPGTGLDVNATYTTNISGDQPVMDTSQRVRADLTIFNSTGAVYLFKDGYNWGGSPPDHQFIYAYTNNEGVNHNQAIEYYKLFRSSAYIRPPLRLQSGLSFGNNTDAAHTLQWYEEGTWTPVDGSGAGLPITVGDARYTRIGRLVVASAFITYPSTGNGSDTVVVGLPYAANDNGERKMGGTVSYTDYPGGAGVLVEWTAVRFWSMTGGAALKNSDVSTKQFRFTVTYTADQ